jgi:hypothetical protein
LESTGGFAYAVPDPILGLRSLIKAVADFNSDGYPDIAALSTDSSLCCLLVNDMGQALIAEVPFYVPASPYCAAAADFNHDGFADLAVGCDVADSGLLLYTGDGSGGLNLSRVLPTFGAADDMIIADLNGDMLPDIVISHGNTNSLSVILGESGGQLKSPTRVLCSDRPGRLDFGDIDNDGAIDVIAEGSRVTVYHNDGLGELSPGRDYDPARLTYGAILIDVDADGFLDLAVDDGWVDEPLWILLNQRNGEFGPPQPCEIARSTGDMAAEDIDGDGLTDLYFGSGRCDVTFLLSGGDGSTFERYCYYVGSAYAPVCSDLDLDGDFDVVLSSDRGIRILWNLRDGPTDVGGPGTGPALLPDEHSLFQNYPNPFNSRTQIEFNLVARSHVKVAIYDVLGRRVALLQDQTLAPGRHRVFWIADRLASGVYFYRFTAGGFTTTKKMLLLK